MSDDIDNALRQLRRALRRFKDDQKATGRRNARRAFGAAVRVLKKRVDEAYPRIDGQQGKGKRKSNRTESAADRLAKRGYVSISSYRIPGGSLTLAEAGVRVRTLGGGVFVPEWVTAVLDIHSTSPHPKLVSELRKGTRDARYRKALLTAKALEQMAG